MGLKSDHILYQTIAKNNKKQIKIKSFDQELTADDTFEKAFCDSLNMHFICQILELALIITL